jgi:lipopolysaccharide/colanic/teichoic acid biosynthesis glycosyltransferase
LSSSNGASLQTLLARATEDKRAAESKALPAWKRALDISCIVLTFPIWLPLLLMVMIWIKAVSPGPIFYRQERVGYRRSRFMIFKFRTMHANAETRSHEEYFAHLMRVNCPMTKLDAQIFNVLRGEMSLVGPRPCLPKEFERYQPCHRRRVNAPPGLTGYWQVNGKNKTTFSQMIAMDILYAKKMSLWLDLTIMLKTIPALISQTAESRLASRTDRTVATGATVHGTNGSTTKI